MTKQSNTKKKKENLTEVEKRSADIAEIMAEEIIEIDTRGSASGVKEIACTLAKRERKKRNMKNRYDILKDPIYKMWVVWENHRNVKIELFKAKTKRECKQWLEENIK